MTARPTLEVDARPLQMPDGPPPAAGVGLPGAADPAAGAAAAEPSHELSDWAVTALTFGGGWLADLTGDATMRPSRFELATLRAIARKLEERGVLTIPEQFTQRRVLIIALIAAVGVMVLVRYLRLMRRRRAAPRPPAPTDGTYGPPTGSTTPVRAPRVVGDGLTT